jgi:pyruvate dehydrogenase E1 component alpha subunit
MFSREKGFFGGHGIVGAQVPLGTGLAFAHKYNKDDGVNLCYMGDGAANQGQVYEAFNMAALWKLPVIYIIENNKYGMGTSVNRAAAGPGLYQRGVGYGIPGVEVDAMDVMTVRDAGLKAVDYVRNGKGPYLMEMQTYRYRGHSMSDPGKYRSKEEVDTMRNKFDPIENLRAYLEKNKLATEADFKSIEQEIKAVVNDAADFAQTSPEPDPSELWTDILLEARA